MYSHHLNNHPVIYLQFPPISSKHRKFESFSEYVLSSVRDMIRFKYQDFISDSNFTDGADIKELLESAIRGLHKKFGK